MYDLLAIWHTVFKGLHMSDALANLRPMRGDDSVQLFDGIGLDFGVRIVKERD
jgi:hypothetical protein